MLYFAYTFARNSSQFVDQRMVYLLSGILALHSAGRNVNELEVIMRKRTYNGTVTQKAKRSDKKVCDLGRACPYQEEYQHLMEFSHDCAPATQRAPQRPLNAFAGTGVCLGSSGGGGHQAINRQNSPSWEAAICCEICSRKIPIHLIETHLASHSGNKNNQNNLKRDQDSEYEQSVIEDIQRQSEVDARRNDEALRQLQAQEAAQLEEVLRTSILASNKGIWRRKAVKCANIHNF